MTTITGISEMRLEVVAKLASYTLTQPVTDIILAKVELNGRNTAYLICYEHNGHVMHKQGNYFINHGEAAKFFELHKKEVDLALDMTPQEKADYATYMPRTHREMLEYLNE